MSELEALVGHLFIVGGRVISSASPGSVAMPPPRRAARGRETDTLFALFVLGSGQRQAAAFYDSLTSGFANKYFTSSGSLTSALREAVVDVHALVASANMHETASLQVGLTCAILREQEVIMAVAGPARSYFIHNGVVERLPGDDEVGQGMRPLGSGAEPDVHLYRRNAQPGNFLILGDEAFARVKDAALLQAVEGSEVDDALSNLRGMIGDFASAEIIQFVVPLPEEQKEASVHSLAETRAQAGKSVRTPRAAPDPSNLPLLRRVGRGAALALANGVDGIRLLSSRMMSGSGSDNPLADRFQMSVSMQIGVAIGVAVLVALTTTMVYLWRGESSQYGQLVREAQTEIEQARAGGDNQVEARPHWENAIFLLNEAARVRGTATEIEGLRSQALAALDAYDHVTRVTPLPLREYPPGAVLNGPWVQGLNLYVIDTTQDILYREDLDQNGTALVNRDSQIITRQGEQIAGQVVGGLIDMAWMESAGTAQRNVLATLSRNGMLITYSPSSDVAATVLPGFEAWQDPRALAVFNRDLYILDSGANEIWRYQSIDDSYSSLPQRYFTDTIPVLSDVVDMAIDTNGNIYLLHSAGRISKYFMGREQAFAFEGLPQPLSRPTGMMLSLGLEGRSLLISDPGGGRLYALSVNGTFLTNYKDDQEIIFNALTGVFSQDRPPIMYITAGNKLYYFKPAP